MGPIATPIPWVSHLVSRMMFSISASAQRFRCGDLQAVWLADAEVIEFYDAAGEPLRSISVGGQLKKDAA
jgi:hypothetical protein